MGSDANSRGKTVFVNIVHGRLDPAQDLAGILPAAHQDDTFDAPGIDPLAIELENARVRNGTELDTADIPHENRNAFLGIENDVLDVRQNESGPSCGWP